MGQVIRLSDIYCAKQRERTTAQLRAELDPLTRAWLREFVAEMENEQRFGEMMLRVAREFS